MTNKSYEAAVKLSTGEVVVYHNINTGLFKFHRFIEDKFSHGQKWLYYNVRRKKTHEIVGNFRNPLMIKKKEIIRLYLNSIQNKKRTGYFIPIPYERNNFTIIRNIFIANSQILEVKSDQITIYRWIYDESIKKGKEDLYQYYLSKEHKIEREEISLGKIKFDIIEQENNTVQSHPLVDYP